MRSRGACGLALVMLAACGNGGQTAAPRTAPPGDAAAAAAPADAGATAPDNTSDARTDMTTITHRVRTADDLQASLYQALAAAEQQGGTLRVELEAGRHGAVRIPSGGATPSASVEVVGVGGIAIIAGPLAVDGRTVTVRDVVVEPGRVTAGVVSIRAIESIAIDGLAVIGATSRASDIREAAVHLRALGPAAKAVLARLWIVGTALDGRGWAVLDTAGDGDAGFDSVEITDAVLAGNRAPIGVRTWYAKQVTLRSFAILEPEFAKPYIWVRSPDTTIALDDGVVATKRLVEHDVDPDEAPLASFPKLQATRVTLRGPSAKEHVAAADSPHQPAAKAPASWDAVIEAARRLEKPDVAALAALLK